MISTDILRDKCTLIFLQMDKDQDAARFPSLSRICTSARKGREFILRCCDRFGSTTTKKTIDALVDDIIREFQMIVITISQVS